jgi:hypothetical protein
VLVPGMAARRWPAKPAHWLAQGCRDKGTIEKPELIYLVESLRGPDSSNLGEVGLGSGLELFSPRKSYSSEEWRGVNSTVGLHLGSGTILAEIPLVRVCRFMPKKVSCRYRVNKGRAVCRVSVR